jgi:hypothetical protein
MIGWLPSKIKEKKYHLEKKEEDLKNAKLIKKLQHKIKFNILKYKPRAKIK